MVKPITPGEILFEEFMKPLNITQNKLAKDIDMPQNIINQIINDEHKITTDIALRLGKYFNIEPEFWLNLQNRFDLKMAQGRVTNEY
jgi:addiction module HigA family antidote